MHFHLKFCFLLVIICHLLSFELIFCMFWRYVLIWHFPLTVKLFGEIPFFVAFVLCWNGCSLSCCTDYFLSTWHKTSVNLGRGDLKWRIASIKLVCLCGIILIYIWSGRVQSTSCRWWHPWAGGAGWYTKASWASQ